MTVPTWYIVRYMPDLQRREPRNVGIVLRAEEGQWLTKFLGEREDGSINGRLLRRDMNAEVYKTWVSYYRRKASEDAWRDVQRMQLARSRNFFAEHGGEFLGRTPSWKSLLDDLFAELVEPPTVATSTPAVKAERITSRVERILDEAGVMPQRNVEVPARFGDDFDLVPFRYSYQNGQVHLMDVLPTRRNPFDAAKDARELRARVQGVRDAGHITSFVAFYDRDLFPEEDLVRILRPVQSVSLTVDIGKEQTAARTVQTLMSHHDPLEIPRVPEMRDSDGYGARDKRE